MSVDTIANAPSSRLCRSGKINASYRHGMSATRLHRIWRGIKQRCENKKYHMYPLYGARGITICDRWKGPDGFTNFYADMGDAPSPSHSIERKDNSLSYTPDNCKWATNTEQGRNRRTNRLLTANGVTMCAIAWAEKMGMSHFTLSSRLRSGMSEEDAILTPVNRRKGQRR